MEELNGIKKTESLIIGQRNKLLIYIIICMALNVLVSQYTPVGQSRHLDGRSATQDEIAYAAIHTILIGIPLIGLILGAAISLFPYKGLPYSKKYLPFSLVIILSIETILFILSIITIIK